MKKDVKTNSVEDREALISTTDDNEFPIENKSIEEMALLSLKRSYDMFICSRGEKIPLDEKRSFIKFQNIFKTLHL